MTTAIPCMDKPALPREAALAAYCQRNGLDFMHPHIWQGKVVLVRYKAPTHGVVVEVNTKVEHQLTAEELKALILIIPCELSAYTGGQKGLDDYNEFWRLFREAEDYCLATEKP